MNDSTCFQCGGGSAALYCLNCAEDSPKVKSLRACLLGIIREEHTTVENWLVHAPFMEGVSAEDVAAVLPELRELEKELKPC